MNTEKNENLESLIPGGDWPDVYEHYVDEAGNTQIRERACGAMQEDSTAQRFEARKPLMIDPAVVGGAPQGVPVQKTHFDQDTPHEAVIRRAVLRNGAKPQEPVKEAPKKTRLLCVWPEDGHEDMVCEVEASYMPWLRNLIIAAVSGAPPLPPVPKVDKTQALLEKCGLVLSPVPPVNKPGPKGRRVIVTAFAEDYTGPLKLYDTFDSAAEASRDMGVSSNMLCQLFKAGAALGEVGATLRGVTFQYQDDFLNRDESFHD